MPLIIRPNFDIRIDDIVRAIVPDIGDEKIFIAGARNDLVAAHQAVRAFFVAEHAATPGEGTLAVIDFAGDPQLHIPAQCAKCSLGYIEGCTGAIDFRRRSCRIQNDLPFPIGKPEWKVLNRSASVCDQRAETNGHWLLESRDAAERFANSRKAGFHPVEGML